MRIKKLIMTTAAALALSTVGAFAATLDVNSVTGTWANATPTSGISGLGTSSISWGNGASPSGYTFVGAAPPSVTVSEGTNFVLGTFTHNNFPITGTVLEKVDLNVSVIVGGGIGLVSSVFSFLHNETTNSGTCAFPSVTPCADKVKASLNFGSSGSFQLGGLDYVFTVSGFEVGGTLFDSFVTQEGGINTASLIGKFVTSESVAPVPLPAAGWMLLVGLGSVAAMRRKKRKVA